MKKKIEIFDTTLRDGEQSPGFSMNVKNKIQLALQLEKLCVDVIEAGFPIASEGDFEAVKEISQTVRKSGVAALCRTKSADIERAWEAVQYAEKPRIHTFIATSDLHMKYKLKKTSSEVLKDVEAGVAHACSLCNEIEFSAEDASRSDPDFLVDVFTTAVENGAKIINIPDTVGYSIPDEFGELIRYIAKKIPNRDTVKISVHCHNDLGLAAANSLSGVVNGATQIECTVNGIGERAGNASLEEVVMAIQTKQKVLDCYTGIDSKEIYPASVLLETITGIGVQPNKAVVGRNAFAHEAGIHQDGVLKNPLTYEIMTPQSVGVPNNRLVIGKHSGRHAIAKKLAELGFSLTVKELDTVYKEIINFCDSNRSISESNIIRIAQSMKAGIPGRLMKLDSDHYEQAIMSL